MGRSGSIQKWLQLKQYHLELTFAVYMFTPWEKFAFCEFPEPSESTSFFRLPPFLTFSLSLSPDSIFFLLFSLTFIAAILYLPHHISFLVGRAWYYINGEHIDVAEAAMEVVKEMSASVLQETTTTSVEKLAQTVAREL